MKLFLKYWYNDNINEISIFFKDEDVLIYKSGTKYDKLFEKIKNLNKQEITEFFSYKHEEDLLYNVC